MTHHNGRPPVAEPLCKPMHLRLSVRADAYINQLADSWGARRQDVVRHIIALYMERNK